MLKNIVEKRDFFMNGNIIVGQSGGPTSVINSSLVGVLKAAQKADCKKIYGMRNGIEGLLEERIAELKEYIKNDYDVELLKRTPSSFLGTCRYKLPPFEKDCAVYEKLFKILDKFDIKHFFYIGGNDSMDTIAKLSEYAKSINSDITFMGIPKTIDNDLAYTDHTPGYGSAAKYIASVIKEIILDTDTYTTDSVTIVEIMGRNAGWLTAASALARAEDCTGPDLIYLPEIPFDYDKFVNDIMEVKKRKSSAIVAVSEGVRDKNGVYICEAQQADVKLDVFGHKMLGETALLLSNGIARDTGMKSRGIILSTLQRCASHIASLCDVSEAYEAGAAAVAAALKGETGKMTAFKRISNEPYKILTETHDVASIANVERNMPPEWITDNGTYVSEDFIKYARPLIIGELAPFMVDGLPRHLTIRD